MPQTPWTLLLTDDESDWRYIFQRAAEKAGVPGKVQEVESGEKLLAYLAHEGEFAPDGTSPTPSLIILDLNMPGIGGFGALAAIKGNPKLCHLPVLILSSSTRSEDVKRAYAMGASTYVTKPGTIQGLVEFLVALKTYWGAAQLP